MAVHLIGVGRPYDPRSIDLATRTGSRIDNARELQLDAAIMKARVRQHQQSHPTIELRSAASTYNCAGMVFASRRTAIDVLLVRGILGDDEYRQIPCAEARMGDIVLYLDHRNQPAHVGMLVRMAPRSTRELDTMKVLSQWGADGEYLHAPRDVPACFGSPSEYWTDRRLVW